MNFSSISGSCYWIQWKPTSTGARRGELSVWHYPDWDLNDDINFSFICNISKCHDQNNQDKDQTEQHNELIYKSSAMEFFLLFFTFFFQWFGVSTKKESATLENASNLTQLRVYNIKTMKKVPPLKNFSFSDFFSAKKSCWWRNSFVVQYWLWLLIL